MKKVCAWCNKELGAVPDPSGIHSESIITHGICHNCANKIFLKMGMKLITFLDSLDAPVVIVTETGNVKTANKQAQELLQKDLSDIEGFESGEVFKCAYSKLPEGCGKTIHCSGCTIRKTVMDTFQSGKSHKKTPAYLNVDDPENSQKIDLLISTEKVGEVVLLRIDEFGGNESAQPIAALDA